MVVLLMHDITPRSFYPVTFHTVVLWGKIAVKANIEKHDLPVENDGRIP